MTWADMTNEQKKDRVRKRIRAAVDPDSYIYTPAKDLNEHPKKDERQRVGIYANMNKNCTKDHENDRFCGSLRRR